MTQILARSALALLASTALCVSALPAAAATHHHRHHHASRAAHRAAADDPADSGGQAAGRVVDVEAPGRSYTVRKGDTLQKVADKLGVEVTELKRANHLRGSAIRPGQVLVAPGAKGKAYVARSGDTLADIARRFGVSQASLREENGLSRRSRIHAGQKVRLPEGYRDRGAAAAERASQDEEEAAPVSRRLRGRIRPEAAAGEDALTSRSVTGRVVDVPGAARTYRVRKGDTLEKVADKLDTDVAQLKRDNHLRRSRIRPGQVLKGPRSPAKAYVVGPGDTIYSISRRFGVSVESLRAENGLSRRASIHTGEKLRLPRGYRDRGPVTTTIRAPGGAEGPPVRREAAPAPAETPPTGPRPYVPPPRPYAPPPTTAAPPATATPAAPTALTDAQISELGRGKFVWPLQGDIVSDFGPKTVGQRNDGINIRTQAGQPVHAAAGGDVVYAGDQVLGFGNLVLLKHPDGWVTAYAHLARIEVKMQQKVAQGQEIGEAGQTGGLAEPQLHFEVRYAPNPAERARPVDPKLVLPKLGPAPPAEAPRSAPPT